MMNNIMKQKSAISISPDITESETIISFLRPLTTIDSGSSDSGSVDTPTSGIIANGTGTSGSNDDEDDAENQQSYKINGRNIKILCNSGAHRDGSSKVKLKNIVNYQWEIKNYPGHLIAVHIDGKHIAYVIKVVHKTSGLEEGMVRVVNIANGQRSLIKGIIGEVLDLQFALIERIRILACIDLNSLYIHQIDMLSDNLICNLLLKIEDPMENYIPKYNKISWCPNFPDSNANIISDSSNDEDDDEDVSQLIVWSRSKIFQCFNVNQIILAHGVGKHFVKNLTDGYLQSIDTNICITWSVLSPDGTTLGVGSEDGIIRFYQIYFHEKEPRCLHQWTPHHGKPISSFFFLDNLKSWKSTSDIFWRYAITACNNNTEFKMWDCGSWECEQQIKFSIPSLDPAQSNLKFLAEIDSTSSYLVLSNIESKTLYILHISNSSKSKYIIDNKCDNKKSKILIRSISEFPISSPTLSFSIVDASIRKLFKCVMNENYLVDDIEDFDEDHNTISCVVLKMFLVQSKCVQECHILYKTIADENEIENGEEEDDESLVRSDKTAISHSVLVEDTGELYAAIVKNPNLIKKLKSLQSDEEENDEDVEIAKVSSTNSSFLEKNTELFNDVKNKSKNANGFVEENLKKSPLIPSLASIEPPPIPTDIEAPPASVLNQFSSPQICLMTPESFSNTTGGTISLKQSASPVETVNSNVFNTILMLANVTNSNPAAKQTDLFVNNKIIEDQQKLRAADKSKSQSNTKFVAIDQKAMEPIPTVSSPPSREVEEIMGLSESNLSQFSFESEKNYDISNMLDVSNRESAKKKTPLTDWPKVPDIKPVQKTLNDIPTIIPNSNNVSTSTQVKTLTTSTSTDPANAATSTELTSLNQTLHQLINVIQVQSKQIQSLEKEVNQLKFRDNSLSIATATSDLIENKLEAHVKRIFENYFNRIEKLQREKFKEFLNASEMKNNELRDRMQSNNQAFFNQLLEKISQTLKVELQRSVVSALVTRLDTIQRQIQAQVAEKLLATDQTMKDSILQLCKSKSIIDTFGKSVLHGVQGSLQAAFIESMSSTLIPAYEKSSQQMFRQLHDTFSMGIKDVMEQLDNYLTQLQPVQDTTDEILSRIVKFREQVESLNQRQCQEITENYMETKKELKSLEINFTRHFSEVIKKEMRKNFESQVASLEDSVLSAVRSQAATPAPTTVFDVQDQIKQLLKQGQINLAFHQALLANDLVLVEYTLEKADYKTVFNPCRLEQTVLLSLIQQISADMTHHNELKQKYMSDGILNLNLSDPITKEHSPKVMKELYRNCQNYIQANSKSSLCSNIRMIMMAIQGMGYKFI